MRLLSLVVIILNSLLGQTALAETPKCGEVFSSAYELNGRIEIHSKVSKILPATDYARAITKVDKLLGDLEIPQEYPIKIGRGFVFSNFTIESGAVFVGVKKFSDNQTHQNLNTLLHEYGHAVFESNFLKKNKNYRILQEKLISQHQMLKQLDSDFLLLDQALAEKRDFAYIESIQSRIERNSAQIKEQAKKIGPYTKVHEAMHELFADVTALIITRDPKVISNLVDSFGVKAKKHSYEDLNRRDFAIDNHSEALKQWGLFAESLKNGSEDAYFALLPTRWELWKILEPKMKNKEYEQQILSKLFKVLENKFREVQKMRAEEFGEHGYGDLYTLNRHLVEELRRELE